MKNRLSVCAISIAIGAVFLVTGCATSNNNSVTIPAANAALSFAYGSPLMADQLRNAGLGERFVEYWQAHADKNWKRRYAMEKFPRDLEEKFYVAYHANAWQLKSVAITGVQITEKEATVDVVLTVVDPEKKIEIPQYQRDKWVVIDSVWRHVVQDPMLSGTFQ